jgi:SAM-dependent methyltransferase
MPSGKKSPPFVEGLPERPGVIHAFVNLQRTGGVLSPALPERMPWYEHWFGSPYYQLLYGHRNEAEARAWVDAIMDRWRPPPGARLLDMGCGRGRHAQWFAGHGLSVTGIDLDAASVATARQAVPGVRFVVHDMRQPFASGTYDLAICLFTSLGYTDDPADDQQVFAAAFHALRPGGRFVLDFMNSAAVIRALVAEEEVRRGEVVFTLRRSLEQDTVVKRITVRDAGAAYDFEERVRALAPGDLEAMARAAGFQVEDRTDGPVPAPFDPERSQRFVLWMRKPGP